MALTVTLNNKTISKISVNFKFFKIYIYIPSMHGRCKHSGEFLSNSFLCGRKGEFPLFLFFNEFFFLYANFNFTE